MVLIIFFGTGSIGAAATTETDYDTFGFTYAMGAATVGVKEQTVDPALVMM